MWCLAIMLIRYDNILLSQWIIDRSVSQGACLLEPACTEASLYVSVCSLGTRKPPSHWAHWPLCLPHSLHRGWLLASGSSPPLCSVPVKAHSSLLRFREQQLPLPQPIFEGELGRAGVPATSGVFVTPQGIWVSSLPSLTFCLPSEGGGLGWSRP